VDGLEAVPAGMSVEQDELLAAMRNMVSVVDIQLDAQRWGGVRVDSQCTMRGTCCKHRPHSVAERMAAA